MSSQGFLGNPFKSRWFPGVSAELQGRVKTLSDSECTPPVPTVLPKAKLDPKEFSRCSDADTCNKFAKRMLGVAQLHMFNFLKNRDASDKDAGFRAASASADFANEGRKLATTPRATK